MTTQPLKWKRSFFTIWAGQAVSLVTSGILQMAIIFYLTNKTGSAMVLSIATLAGFLPQAIFGPIIGVFVDRYSRKFVMIGADLMIAAAGAALAISALFIDLPVWMILAVLFIRSIGTAFHLPALSAVTPLLVPEEQPTKCAGYSQAIQSAGSILSPAAAAFLYSVWNLNAIIVVDIIGAIAACITVAFASIPNSVMSETAAKGNLVQEMKDGYTALRENKGLFALLWISAVYMFVYMPISSLFPLISMGYFGGTPAHASAAEIAFAIGMLAGGLLLGLWGGFKNRVTTMLSSILLMGISLTISGLLPANGFLIFATFCVLMGFSGPFYGGVQTALFQEKIKPEFLGRVFSLMGSVISLAMPLGLIFLGMFADKIGINRWFLLSGIAIIGIALLSPLVPAVRKCDC